MFLDKVNQCVECGWSKHFWIVLKIFLNWVQYMVQNQNYTKCICWEVSILLHPCLPCSPWSCIWTLPEFSYADPCRHKYVSSILVSFFQRSLYIINFLMHLFPCLATDSKLSAYPFISKFIFYNYTVFYGLNSPYYS